MGVSFKKRNPEIIHGHWPAICKRKTISSGHLKANKRIYVPTCNKNPFYRHTSLGHNGSSIRLDLQEQKANNNPQVHIMGYCGDWPETKPQFETNEAVQFQTVRNLSTQNINTLVLNSKNPNLQPHKYKSTIYNHKAQSNSVYVYI